MKCKITSYNGFNKPESQDPLTKATQRLGTGTGHAEIPEMEQEETKGLQGCLQLPPTPGREPGLQIQPSATSNVQR